MSIFKKHIRKNPIASTNCEAEISSVTSEDASAIHDVVAPVVTEDCTIAEDVSTILDADISTDVDNDIITEKPIEVPIVDDYNIVDELKDILEKRWEEEEEKESIPYEEMFQELVDEAVYLIKEGWKSSAEISSNYCKRIDNEITLRVYDAFFVSDNNRNLYADSCTPTYPKTNKGCFFETLAIPDEEEEQRFVNCVMEKLPQETKVEMFVKKCKGITAGRHYTFTITFTAPKRS